MPHPTAFDGTGSQLSSRVLPVPSPSHSRERAHCMRVGVGGAGAGVRTVLLQAKVTGLVEGTVLARHRFGPAGAASDSPSPTRSFGV